MERVVGGAGWTKCSVTQKVAARSRANGPTVSATSRQEMRGILGILNVLATCSDCNRYYSSLEPGQRIHRRRVRAPHAQGARQIGGAAPCRGGEGRAGG